MTCKCGHSVDDHADIEYSDAYYLECVIEGCPCRDGDRDWAAMSRAAKEGDNGDR